MLHNHSNISNKTLNNSTAESKQSGDFSLYAQEINLTNESKSSSTNDALEHCISSLTELI